MVKNIAICAWNMRGFDISIPYLRYLIEQYHIVCINEHWLFKNQVNRIEDVASDIDYICHTSKHSGVAREELGLYGERIWAVLHL